MSKIEDALNKARARTGEKNKTSDRQADGSDQALRKSSVRDLIPSAETSLKGINRKSSSKEISLMENGEILDNEALSELKIIFSSMSDDKTANTYRDLRTKLIQKNKGQNFICMVTSCVPGKGFERTSLNVAAAFSFDESKTSLLIDCNLNNPRLDTLLNMNTVIGLTDYLEDESVNAGDIMHSTGIKRLKVIPAGTSSETSTEYFTSMRMRELMSGLLTRYSDRYIFLDAAPINISADTRILVELCDYVILVVPYGLATKNKVKEAIEAIDEDKLLGVVFNEVPKLPKINIFKAFKP
ncbi:hypothetical protein MNBD_GAMMA11-1324 [hydrothermal vent metagenome]|uniref:Non-specific protein-tyrosine kinase n=1 Tax=hydrothermal vent metagenome TaxID=652676 RepID=A0A3B0XJA2_9ZZZZ